MQHVWIALVESMMSRTSFFPILFLSQEMATNTLSFLSQQTEEEMLAAMSDAQVGLVSIWFCMLSPSTKY